MNSGNSARQVYQRRFELSRTTDVDGGARLEGKGNQDEAGQKDLHGVTITG